MIIRQLYLKNFRGFSEINVSFNENLNVIIGKNDIGKSTILEALAIFFESDTVKIEIDDLKVGSSPQITIGVVFRVDPSKEYLIDSERKTSLTDEHLLNSEGFLEIRKVWDCSKSLSAKSLTTFFVSQYFTDFKDNPLITLKIGDLKKVANDNNLDDFVQDKRVLSDFRKAIYQNTSNQQTETVLIPIDKEDSKKVYLSISSEFPYFALFQSDRQNKDSDKEVQDPLKVITKQAISEVEDKLKEVVEEIEKKAIEKGKKTIEKLAEMNPEIAKTLDPNVKNRNWDSLFSFSFIGDEGIPMNKRGSGVRRLILLNYFRAEAEENSGKDKNVVYAIEEPETSQHPEHQMMLITALIKLANNPNRQVLITTHSPEIAKIAKDENLILLSRDDLKNPKIIIETDSKLPAIRETLGILPYLSRLVVCVEGENDVKFLKNINENIPELKKEFDLAANNISVIPLQGGNLINWVNRNYLKGSNVVEFHIYDRDSNSGKNTEQYKEQCDYINNRPDNSRAVLTNKKEFENYIHASLINGFFSVDCSTLSDWDNSDLPQFLASKSGRHENEIKSILNGSLAKKLTKKHLEELHAFEEVKGWFTMMKELYQ